MSVEREGTSTMRALVVTDRGSIDEQHLPRPAVGAGQVLVEMRYVGICGSDIKYFFEGANSGFVITEPLVLGHEAVGLVADDPSGRYPPGTPVAVHPGRFGPPEPGLEEWPHLWRGGSYLGSAATTPHTQGAMAEYLLVEAQSIRPLPEGVPLVRAVLAEPLAVVLHALGKVNLRERRILVSGCGPIGLLAVAAARHRGAGNVTAVDVEAAALERARTVGASRVLDAREDRIPDDFFDVVVECSGAPAALTSALRCVRRAGAVLQVGMVADGSVAIEVGLLITKEIRYLGSFRFNDELDAALELLSAAPELDHVVTHVVPYGRADEAFRLAADGAVSAKVAIGFGTRPEPMKVCSTVEGDMHE